VTPRRKSSGFPAEARTADENRRRRLARLPIEEKLRLLVELQRLAADIARSRGRPVRLPWRLDE